MTAPSLLDELAGVVKFLLGEEALDGRWFGDEPPVHSSGMKRRYWWRTDLRKAHADMAKRLEAAERDAARWRHARKLLTVDDIGGAQGSYDSFGRLVSENECKRADDAIDAAMHNSAREDGE